MSGIDFPRRDLAYVLAERIGREQLSATVAKTGSFDLVDARGRPVVVIASGFAWDARGLRILPPAGSREVAATFFRGGPDSQERTIVSSADAYLITDLGPDRFSRRYEFKLEFLNARTRDAAAAAPGPDAAPPAERAVILIAPLAPADSPLPELLQKGSFELLAQADTRPTDDFLQTFSKELRRKIHNLNNTVLARTHERLARTVACGLMVLTGAIAALTLTRRTPLTVYLWCFLPALVTLVTITGGEQVTQGMGPAGLLLLWGGVVGLGFYTLLLYARLARH